MKNRAAFLPLLFFALLVAALTIAIARHAGQGDKFALHVGDQAPVTQAADFLSGAKEFSTASREGRAYLVNFFASWCAPCKAEHEGLMRLAQEGVPIIGIAFNDKPSVVKNFLAKNGNPYRMVIRDAGSRIAIDWGLVGVPETFIVDKNGVIRFHSAGPLSDEAIARKVMPLWEDLR